MPNTATNISQLCLAQLMGNMVHLLQCTEHIWGKKCWCDIQHQVMKQPTPYISTLGTHCDTPVEWDKSRKPCHSSKAPSPGLSHQTVVAATVRLQTNCYLGVKTCSLPPENLTFIIYKWVCVCVCVVWEYMGMCECMPIHQHTHTHTHPHNDNMADLQLWNIFKYTQIQKHIPATTWE